MVSHELPQLTGSPAPAAERKEGEDHPEFDEHVVCSTQLEVQDWCVDVAHDPRQPVDNLPENQCRSYREGKVHHFVELDPEGNVIRAM